MNITEFLKDRFPDAEISADGEGLSTLARHKLVMSSLKDQFQSGEVHALSLETKTPSEIS